VLLGTGVVLAFLGTQTVTLGLETPAKVINKQWSDQEMNNIGLHLCTL
jgi:hypothetical protein